MASVIQTYLSPDEEFDNLYGDMNQNSRRMLWIRRLHLIFLIIVLVSYSSKIIQIDSKHSTNTTKDDLNNKRIFFYRKIFSTNKFMFVEKHNSDD